MTESTKSLEHDQDELDEELKTTKTDTKDLDSAVKEIEQNIENYPNINKKLIQLKDRSSGDNIRQTELLKLLMKPGENVK